jgi:hypothetical protein
MDTRKVHYLAVATLVGAAAVTVSDTFWTTAGSGSFMTQAEARIGRPFTPFSIAGVARRSYRRAAWGGALGLGVGYGLGYGYGSGYGYGYPYSYSSFGYGYSGYPYYGYSSYSSYPYYGGGYGYYRPFGWRLGLW